MLAAAGSETGPRKSDKLWGCFLAGRGLFVSVWGLRPVFGQKVARRTIEPILWRPTIAVAAIAQGKIAKATTIAETTTARAAVTAWT